MIPRQTRRSRKHSARCVVLITTLLILSLFTVMTLAMVIAMSSDTLINGYYRNFRGAFYSSDSGLNIARQSMLAQLTAAPPATFTPTTQPISSTTATTIQSNILSTYGASY